MDNLNHAKGVREGKKRLDLTYNYTYRLARWHRRAKIGNEQTNSSQNAEITKLGITYLLCMIVLHNSWPANLFRP